MKKIAKGIVTLGVIFSVCGITSLAAKAAHGCFSAVAGHNKACDYDYHSLCHFLDIDGSGIYGNCGSGRCRTDTECCPGYTASNAADISNTTTLPNEVSCNDTYANSHGCAGRHGNTIGQNRSGGHGCAGRHGH